MRVCHSFLNNKQTCTLSSASGSHRSIATAVHLLVGRMLWSHTVRIGSQCVCDYASYIELQLHLLCVAGSTLLIRSVSFIDYACEAVASVV